MSKPIIVSQLHPNKIYLDKDVNNIKFVSDKPLRYKHKCMMKCDAGIVAYIADSGLLSILLQGYYDAGLKMYDFNLENIYTSDDITLSQDGFIYDGDDTVYVINSLTAKEIVYKNKTSLIIRTDKDGKAMTSVDMYNILDIDSCILMQSFR